MLSRSQLIETAAWIVFAIGAYAMTYQFDRPLEIYEFGASGWPRVVLVLILIAALCQAVDYRRKHLRGEVTEVEEVAKEHRTRGDWTRLALLLGTPVVYALILPFTGFYVTTPFFVVAFLLIVGERRWGHILGITAFIYLFLLIVFTKLLYVGLPVGYVQPFYDISNALLVLIR